MTANFAPLARLYVAARSPIDGAPTGRFIDVPDAARFADAALDLDDGTWATDPPAEPIWRWTLAVIAVGCAVVFGLVPLVRWWL